MATHTRWSSTVARCWRERAVKLLPINPETLGAPLGYSHGMLAPEGGRILFLAGELGWDRDSNLVSDSFAGQFERALANLVEVARAAGGDSEHIGSLTIFVTDRMRYLQHLKEVGRAYRRVMGRHYPAMALVEVQALLHPQALCEVQGIAVLPPGESPAEQPE